MFEAKGSFFVRLPELMRTTTFRWTLLASGAFAICTLLMFGFVLIQAYVSLTADVDGLITEVAKSISAEEPQARARRVNEHLRVDPRRVKVAGLFAADGTRLAGNVESLPARLTLEAGPHLVPVLRIDASGQELQTVRALALRLPEGGSLVVGRNDYELEWVADTLQRALALGLIPALCLGLGVGAFLSVRAQRRVDEVNRSIQRIVTGELRERLPTQRTSDSFDRLASLVNGMLDDIEALVRSMAGVGDDIAHDLRTPLTRVRVGLERARQRAIDLAELRLAVDQAILGLDQSLGIITALLRIAEIEHGRRLAGFRRVELATLLREVGDLYEPIAEDKRLSLVLRADEEIAVNGDHDLLFEAIANLVDNALKFTPTGGRIELSLKQRSDEAIVSVSDTGPGIPVGEEGFVTKRFYRSDKSRRDPGFGLGLSLVNAIVKLHGFRFTISPGPGCVAEIAAPSVIPV